MLLGGDMGVGVIEGKFVPFDEVFHLHHDVVRRHQPVTRELLGHGSPGSNQGICHGLSKQNITHLTSIVLLPQKPAVMEDCRIVW